MVDLNKAHRAYLNIVYRSPEAAIKFLDAELPVVFYDPHGEVSDAQNIDIVRTPTQMMAYLSQRGGPGDIPELWTGAGHEQDPEVAQLHTVLSEALLNRQITKNTGRDRTRHILTTGLRNLHHLTTAGVVSPDIEPWKGKTVFVVSAGPSLDKNVHLLGEAMDKGIVLCVNTSVRPVVHHHGRVPYVISIEAKFSGHHLDGTESKVGTAIVDLTAHPDTHEWATRTGGHILFTAANSISRSLTHRFGVPLVNYGASVATAAVAYAATMGAKRIVLVGQDCAYGEDGQIYASHTAYEHHRWEHSTPGRIISAKGHELIEKDQPFTIVPGWGGTKAITVSDLLLFSRWFEAVANGKISMGLELINATEGGMSIPGWEEQTLQQVLDDTVKSDSAPPLTNIVDVCDSGEISEFLEREWYLCNKAEISLESDRFRDMYQAIFDSQLLRNWLEHMDHPRVYEAGKMDLRQTPQGIEKTWVGFPKVAFLGRLEKELAGYKALISSTHNHLVSEQSIQGGHK